MTNYFDDNKAREGHGRRSLRGGAISVVARAVNAGVQVGSFLFLARLLSPEDYGLVGMVTAITGLAPLLLDLGTRDAVGQQDRITPGEISTLFWTTVGMGCGFGLLVAAAGPLIARLYGEPRLTVIALLTSVSIVASALTYQHQALLRRAMMFQELAVIDVGANVLSAAGAIAIAFCGGGYWALVLRLIATNGLTAVGVWFYCRWCPVKPTLTSGVKQMLRFGIQTVGFSAAYSVGRNCDRVAIGLTQGARSLGYFQNALLVYDNLLDLTTPLQAVALVSLSKLRDNLEQLRTSWQKALSALAFYMMPAFGFMAISSQDLIVFVLGEKWSTAGTLLSVLALRGMPHVVELTSGWLHQAAGRPDRMMRWGIIATSVQVVALFSGLPFGTMGVVSAYVVAMYFLFVPMIAYAGRPLGIGATDLLKAVGKQLVGALSAVGLGLLMRHTLLADTQRPARIALLAVTYFASYFVVVVGLFRVRTPLSVAVSLLRDFIPARRMPLGGLGFPGGNRDG